MEAYFTFLIEQLWGKRRIMEVYLNVAETGIGTYGVNAGSQRYFGHDASAMSRTEAARIAAVLPLPKQRGAIAPKGFTRRYGGTIAARIGVVGRDGLDACVADRRHRGGEIVAHLGGRLRRGGRVGGIRLRERRHRMLDRVGEGRARGGDALAVRLGMRQRRARGAAQRDEAGHDQRTGRTDGAGCGHGGPPRGRDRSRLPRSP